MAVPGLGELLRILNLPIRADKCNRLLDLPQKGETAEVGYQRVERLLASDYGSYLGCTRQVSFKQSFAMQTIAEVKTKVIEEALQSNFHRFQPFLGKVTQMAAGLGVVDQSILKSIPPIEVMLLNIQQQQEIFDRLRAAYWDNDEDIVFNRVLLTALDPERILTTRNSHLILQANASLRNNYRG